MTPAAPPPTTATRSAGSPAWREVQERVMSFSELGHEGGGISTIVE
jgi:hypothetical protein